MRSNFRNLVGGTLLGSGLFTQRETNGSSISITAGSIQPVPVKIQFGFGAPPKNGFGPPREFIHIFIGTTMRPGCTSSSKHCLGKSISISLPRPSSKGLRIIRGSFLQTYLSRLFLRDSSQSRLVANEDAGSKSKIFVLSPCISTCFVEFLERPYMGTARLAEPVVPVCMSSADRMFRNES